MPIITAPLIARQLRRAPEAAATGPWTRWGHGSSRAGTSHRGDFGVADETELSPDLLLNRLGDGRILLHELLHVLAPLSESLTTEREPRAALVDDFPVDREVEQVPFLRDTLAIHDIEFRL